MLMENRILEMLEGITADLTVMKTDLRGLSGDVAGLKTDVAGLKTDVAGLKTDVAGLKADVAGLKADVAELKTDVAELKTDMAVVKVEIEMLKRGQKRIELRLENEIEPKLNALYDAQQANAEQIAKLKENQMWKGVEWIPPIPALTALYNQVQRHEDGMKENGLEIQKLKRAVFS